MDCVTIELTPETLEDLDAYADRYHDADREEAVNELLVDWLGKQQ